MKLHISPCPNDTFTFHALIHRLVETEGLDFSVAFSDIDALNAAALAEVSARGEEDVIKVSYASLPPLLDAYRLLESGSALGHGNGPLVVSRRKIYPDELPHVHIGIPGWQTTGNCLLSLLFPAAASTSTENRRVYLFSEIAEAVADGEVDAGVLIHEGRFTYADRGLRLVVDLGEEWERLTRLPIPLGGILVHKRHSLEVAGRISRAVRRSIEFAQAHPEASADYVRQHAQELAASVRQQHIDCFVNNYSLALGEQGREAIYRLLGNEAQVIEFV